MGRASSGSDEKFSFVANESETQKELDRLIERMLEGEIDVSEVYRRMPISAEKADIMQKFVLYLRKINKQSAA